MTTGRTYEPKPRYALPEGAIDVGWIPLAAALPDRRFRLAIDGPSVMHWDGLVRGIGDLLEARDQPVRLVDTRLLMADWNDIVERTASPALIDDPDFAKVTELGLIKFFDRLPNVSSRDGSVIVFGPGAALLDHDLLWYADLPKRYAESLVSAKVVGNLGQDPKAGPGSTKRLFYIDWPVLDRHRDSLTGQLDRWIDMADPDRPTSIDGEVLRLTLEALAHRPFRTRPTFNSAPWGGHWGQTELGLNRSSTNSALGYELIAPESGVLIGSGDDAEVEFPFQLLASYRPKEILGDAVVKRFGSSFPIRFDYLDTMGGGNLSVHCHPQPAYMRDVFGWPYTQHESYYVMVSNEGAEVFLGLQEGVDLDAFQGAAHDAARDGLPLKIDDYVQRFPATTHCLFMIPAGTPHGSGEGNVILEVSATPYLYSLRFYDWLRPDLNGGRRPVHVGHAFANLDTERTGHQIRSDLIQHPVVDRRGTGWREEVIGALPEVFFEVRRLVIDGQSRVSSKCNDRFHVLNVVEGDGAVITTPSGTRHRLNFAETMVIPAAVAEYSVEGIGRTGVQIVKALVR